MSVYRRRFYGRVSRQLLLCGRDFSDILLTGRYHISGEKYRCQLCDDGYFFQMLRASPLDACVHPV